MTWTSSEADRLGATLRDLRGHAGLTQEQLAYRAGITKNQVQLLEHGRVSGRRPVGEPEPSNPRMRTLDGLASALGITVSELLSRAGL